MNAIVKVEAGVMTLRVKFAHSVLGFTLQGIVRKIFIAARNVFAAASTLTIGHLRNGGTSLSSVTPDFIY